MTRAQLRRGFAGLTLVMALVPIVFYIGAFWLAFVADHWFAYLVACAAAFWISAAPRK